MKLLNPVGDPVTTAEGLTTQGPSTCKLAKKNQVSFRSRRSDRMWNLLTVVNDNKTIHRVRAGNRSHVVDSPRGSKMDGAVGVPCHLDSIGGRGQHGLSSVRALLEEVTIDVENRLETRPVTKLHYSLGDHIVPHVRPAAVGERDVSTEVTESNALGLSLKLANLSASVGLDDGSLDARHRIQTSDGEREGDQRTNLEGRGGSSEAVGDFQVSVNPEEQTTLVERKGGFSFNANTEATLGRIVSLVVNVQAGPIDVLVSKDSDVGEILAAIPSADIIDLLCGVVEGSGSRAA